MKEIDHFDRFGITNITVMGGEPTEYQDLFRVLGYMKSNCRGTISVVTNGVRISRDPEYRKELGRLVDSVNVSVNDLEGLDVIDTISEDFGHVIVNTVVTKDNVDDVAEFAKRISKHRNCFFSPMIIEVENNMFSRRDNIRYLPSKAAIMALAKELKAMKIRGYPIIATFKYLDRMVDYVRGWRWKCEGNAFSKFFALNNDMRITVCQGTKPLDYTLSSLNDDNIKDLEEDIKRTVKNCSGCLYSCTFDSSINRLKKYIEFIPMSYRIFRLTKNG